ncbi:MAG: TonB-dependent receptor [bacterium]
MLFVPSVQRRAYVLAFVLALPASASAQRACEDRAQAQVPPGGWVAPLDTRVSLHVRDVSLRDALDRITALSGIQLAYSAELVPVDRRVCLVADKQPVGELLAALLRGANAQAVVIAGRVVLSPTAPMASMESAAHGMSVLDRVVVTGSAVAAPRRPLVMGMEIIDGEQLRRESQGSLAEILDARVPGMWSWSQSPSAMVAQYGSIRGASSFGTSYPKIYMDGVEVANPLLVTQLNPDVIDRVEVIRGPQGSALYGSDAISGVINILTRHDAGTVGAPLVQFHSSEGAASSAYSNNLVPTHEQRLNVRAGTNVRSAGLAATYGQTGALFPSSETRQLAASGDGRLVTSNATFTSSARFFDKTSGGGQNPLLFGLTPVGNPLGGSTGSTTASPTAATALPQSMREYTLATGAAFTTEGRWTHSFTSGIDGYRLSNVADVVGPISTAVDTALRNARGNGTRYTLRETSVARFGADGDSQTTLTFGLEHSVLRQLSGVAMKVPPSSGVAEATVVDRSVETWNHNTGLLSQLSTSWRDALFLTAGLRVERNDAFTGDNKYPVLPMLGVAGVHNVGGAEVKLRAAYGKGIRPPQSPARSAAEGYANVWGGSLVTPALDPEVQSGLEAGAEVYFGQALTVQVTRFDQRATGLIQNVMVAADTTGGTDQRVRYVPQNVGEITNRGWELQANSTQGAFGFASSFTSVDSRVRTLAAGYNGDLRPGDRMLAVPSMTGSLMASYSGGNWFASVSATRAFDWVNYDRQRLAQAYIDTNSRRSSVPHEITGSQARSHWLQYDGDANLFTGAHLRSYWMKYDGDTHIRLSVSRDLARGVSLLMSGDNLLGGQLGEPDNVTIRAGRTLTGGLRASF